MRNNSLNHFSGPDTHTTAASGLEQTGEKEMTTGIIPGMLTGIIPGMSTGIMPGISPGIMPRMCTSVIVMDV